jgi:hypothetical protein
MVKSRARGPIQLAHDVFLESIGERPKTEPPAVRDPAGVALERKGGMAHAAPLAPEKRTQIAAKRAHQRGKKP